MLRQPMKIKKSRSLIRWVATDGRAFVLKVCLEEYDRPLRREQHKQYFIKNKSWLWNLFFLKGQMRHYDKLQLNGK